MELVGEGVLVAARGECIPWGWAMGVVAVLLLAVVEGCRPVLETTSRVAVRRRQSWEAAGGSGNPLALVLDVWKMDLWEAAGVARMERTWAWVWGTHAEGLVAASVSENDHGVVCLQWDLGSLLAELVAAVSEPPGWG